MALQSKTGLRNHRRRPGTNIYIRTCQAQPLAPSIPWSSSHPHHSAPTRTKPKHPNFYFCQCFWVSFFVWRKTRSVPPSGLLQKRLKAENLTPLCNSLDRCQLVNTSSNPLLSRSPFEKSLSLSLNLKITTSFAPVLKSLKFHHKTRCSV